jgi:hypothetical protein
LAANAVFTVINNEAASTPPAPDDDHEALDPPSAAVSNSADIDAVEASLIDDQWNRFKALLAGDGFWGGTSIFHLWRKFKIGPVPHNVALTYISVTQDGLVSIERETDPPEVTQQVFLLYSYRPRHFEAIGLSLGGTLGDHGSFVGSWRTVFDIAGPVRPQREWMKADTAVAGAVAAALRASLDRKALSAAGERVAKAYLRSCPGSEQFAVSRNSADGSCFFAALRQILPDAPSIASQKQPLLELGDRDAAARAHMVREFTLMELAQHQHYVQQAVNTPPTDSSEVSANVSSRAKSRGPKPKAPAKTVARPASKPGRASSSASTASLSLSPRSPTAKVKAKAAATAPNSPPLSASSHESVSPLHVKPKVAKQRPKVPAAPKTQAGRSQPNNNAHATPATRSVVFGLPCLRGRYLPRLMSLPGHLSLEVGSITSSLIPPLRMRRRG